MIIDLEHFLTQERPYWEELEARLEVIQKDIGHRLDLAEARRLHYLYQRASSDLAKIVTFAAEPEFRSYLEGLVARAYGEVHDGLEARRRFAVVHWFFNTFPQTFRRRVRAFWLTIAVTMVGIAFGALAVALDSEAKTILMRNFPHLQGNPSERVAEEETREADHLAGHKGSFSTFLMTHNTRVSIFTFALGSTWGIGTAVLLFYNGIILGAVALDYVTAGEGVFLVGWLLPHGSIEIPAILLAGQAGFVLASALVGWGTRTPLKARLREVGPDVVTLIFGVALMLVWAGIVEAFFSQYHEPVLPYWLKIAFGVLELSLLVFFLARCGLKKGES